MTFIETSITATVDETSLAAAVHRVKSEYLEMPGLRLTVPQAARLWQLDQSLSEAVLAALVEMRFLVRTRNASYARP